MNKSTPYRKVKSEKKTTDLILDIFTRLLALEYIGDLTSFVRSRCWKFNWIFHEEQIDNLLEICNILLYINNLKSVIHSIVQSLHWETGQFNYKKLR